jgi:hypothetical protein
MPYIVAGFQTPSFRALCAIALMAVEVLAQIAADPAVPAGERIKASGAIPERCGV